LSLLWRYSGKKFRFIVIVIAILGGTPAAMVSKKERKKILQTQREVFSLALIEPAILILLRKINDYLQKHKVKAYVVGGFVRDVLLGRETADIDVAVAGDALRIASDLAEALKGTYVLLDGENKVGRVVLPTGVSNDKQRTIDISTITGTLKNDLARRDFTIDALALDLKELMSGGNVANLVDLHKGRDDLDNGIVRSISEENLSADPVRLLRALRLAVELGFHIEQKTRNYIRHSADSLIQVPGERIREELLRLFSASRGGHFLFDLDELRLLTVLIPELTSTKDVRQPVEHHWDVFTHSIMTVCAVDYLLHQGFWDYAQDEVLNMAPWSSEYAQHFDETVASGSNRRALVKLAALFHDIAKPQTKALDKGRMRFLGHSEEGAEITSNILEKLRFSVRETKMVAGMVKYHLRPTQMGQPPSHRAIYRYFRDTGDIGIDTLYLSLADHLATRGPGLILANWRQHTDIVQCVLNEHYKQETIALPPKLVDGNDLIATFNLKPGPRLGELLEMVREAQAVGELTSREQALEYIRNAITEGKK
jgi:poly(A) polymerase